MIEPRITAKGLSSLIIICGPAGCGKTTLARSLSRMMHIPHIDYDIATNAFIRAIMARDGSKDFSIYAKEYRSAGYQTVLDFAFDNLSLGFDIIISGPFTRESAETSFFTQLTEQYNIPFFSVVVKISLSEDILKYRILSRGLDRDAPKLAHWSEFIKTESNRKWLWKPDALIEIYETCNSNIDRLTLEVCEQLKTIGIR